MHQIVRFFYTHEQNNHLIEVNNIYISITYIYGIFFASIFYLTLCKDIFMKHRKHSAKAIIFFISAVVCTASALAAPVTVTTGTQLVGFDSIDVDGTLYDVRFIDDSFNDLFIDAAGLDFTTEVTANTASQALLSAFDSFSMYDDDPTLTNGCSHSLNCILLTPYLTNSTNVATSYAYNGNASEPDFVASPWGWNRDSDLLGAVNVVYADWSVGSPRSVPEPKATVLIGIGLIGLLGFSRRNNSPTQTVA